MAKKKLNKMRTFTFRISDYDFLLLGAIANRLYRTRSDTLRYLMYKMADSLGIDEDTIEADIAMEALLKD